MKKTFIILTLLMWSSSILWAQNLSLDQALALAKNTTGESAQITVDIQNINLKIQKSKRLPLIYGDGNIQRNLIIPVTPVPAIAFDPTAPEGTMVPLRFATDWSARGGIQLSLDIYNPQNQTNILTAEQQINTSKLDQKINEQDFTNKITDLYAQTYLAQNQLDIAITNEELYATTLEIIKARYDAGRTTKIEWNNAQKKMLDLIQNREEAQYVLKNQYIALSSYLDITTFDHLSTPIEEMMMINDIDLELEKLKQNQELKSQQLSLLKFEALPKLTLNGYLGSQFYNNDLKIFNSDYWYGNSYINIAIRLPITEAYERKLKRMQLQKEYELANVNVENKISNTSVEQQQKINNIAILDKKINQLQHALELSSDNIKIIKSQVDQGRELIIVLNQEIESHMNLQQKLWQAQYDLIKTKLNQ